jgi:hypothetical protein
LRVMVPGALTRGGTAKRETCLCAAVSQKKWCTLVDNSRTFGKRFVGCSKSIRVSDSGEGETSLERTSTEPGTTHTSHAVAPNGLT